MKVSKKAYYGLRAVLTLASSQEPISIRSLAEREQLPEDYLEKILQSLRRAGIVEAKKGIAGGYALGKSADELNVWEVIRVLDGPMKIFASTSKGSLPCLHVSHCQTNEVWRTLEQKIEETLSDISLAQLIPNNISK